MSQVATHPTANTRTVPFFNYRHVFTSQEAEFLGVIRRTAVHLHMIPKTLRSKEWLKPFSAGDFGCFQQCCRILCTDRSIDGGNLFR